MSKNKRLEKFATLFLREQDIDESGREIHKVDRNQDKFEKNDIVPMGLIKK